MLEFLDYFRRKKLSIEFNEAIEIAKENAKILLPNARSFELEGAILENRAYEITLSFINTDLENQLARNADTGIGFVMAALAKRREEKVFIVDLDGVFKGFRNPR